MYIYPAIDLYGGKAVRLFQGDYARMTVYREDPCDAAREFAAAGASHIHLVDLEGAKTGKPENLAVIEKIVRSTGLFAQVGGGIRSMETVESYLSIGVGRVILGTAAVKDPDFLKAALETYGEKIAVGVDLKDGLVAIKGVGRGLIQALMREREIGGPFTAFDEFCRRMNGHDLNRRAAESLIRAGCFDRMGYKRKALMQSVDRVLGGAASESRMNLTGQMNLFSTPDDGGEPADTTQLVLPDVEEFTRAELMAMVNRATGRAPESTSALLSGMKTWKDNADTARWYYLDVQEATNSHTYTGTPTETWTSLTATPDWSQYE